MRYVFGILIVGLALILSYNNCSDVGFSKMPAEVTAVNTSASQSSGLGGLSDDQILRSLPPEEQRIYRPITDLNDPNVANIYACPDDSGGYILCHFPSSDGSEHTICVGSINSALTHSDHQLSFTSDGRPEGDYLGPCKMVPVVQ